MSLLTKVATLAAKGRLFVIDHEAGLEIAGGIACFAVSVATAARAAVKTKEIKEEYNANAMIIAERDQSGMVQDLETGDMKEYTDEQAKADMKKLKRHTAGRIALAWMPPVLGFAAGTGLVLRSHHVMVKTNMGLAAALKTAEASLEEYRKRVGDKIGEEEEQNLYDGVKTVNKKGKKGEEPTVERIHTDLPITMYGRILGRDYVERDADWDITSDRYNKSRVKQVEDTANRKLRRVGKLTLNEVYDSLGLSPTPAGEVAGWRLEKFGGKTPIDGIKITIIEHILKADPNAVSYVHDDWTDTMVRAADPFFVDFNCEGCILDQSVLDRFEKAFNKNKKIGG